MGTRSEFFYRVHVLMGISAGDFAKAKQEALRTVKVPQDDFAVRELIKNLEAKLQNGSWPYSSQ